MKKNMGNLDRGLRVAAALAVVGLYLGDVIGGVVAVVLGVFAAIFLLTSTISYCPAYVPLGISTCPRHDDAEK